PLRASTTDIHPNAIWSKNEITIAGGNGWSSEINQLSEPLVVVDGNEENEAHQLINPHEVIIDKESDSLITNDPENTRVVRWPRQNGICGETIISDIACFGLTMDDYDSLYSVDYGKHEVRRYRIGDTTGSVDGGGNGPRDRLVYVSDVNNHRVMKWKEDATQGIMVAGGQGKGNSLTQLSYPQGAVADQLGTVYVTDHENHRIMRWRKGATQGCVIDDGNDTGA
ncbi:unnamed protein product, partial [Rotaria sp. Silwood2]